MFPNFFRKYKQKERKGGGWREQPSAINKDRNGALAAAAAANAWENPKLIGMECVVCVGDVWKGGNNHSRIFIRTDNRTDRSRLLSTMTERKREGMDGENIYA